MGRTVHVARPRVTPALRPFLAISDSDIIRHPDLAFCDGYTDAKNHGEDGYFVPLQYDQDAKNRYATGFTLGLRLWKLGAQ